MPKKELPLKKRSRFEQFRAQVFPGRNDTERRRNEKFGQASDRMLFEALLKLWGFHKAKNFPDLHKRQYILEYENHHYVYSLSGGAMVLFDHLGRFKEWA